MDWLIGLDVGTSAVKGVVVSTGGEQRARGRRETRFIKPQPGWFEVDPEEHYQAVCSLIRELAAAVPAGETVRALSMAFASGNTLLLDKQDKPVDNIQFWLDTRTMGRTAELLPGFDQAAFHQIDGWPYSEMFPLSHIAWFREHYPVAYRTGRICQNNDYLYYRLTGRWGMDPSTAATFHLQHQESRSWHQPYLDLLDLSEEKLPTIIPSGKALGPLTEQAAGDTGLSTDTLLVLGAFDHPCAARGTGVHRVGDLLLSCGTSWVGFYPIVDRQLGIDRKLLVDSFLSPDGPWGCMFALTAIAVNIDRYLERYIFSGSESASEKYALFSRLAEACDPGAEGLMINLYQGNKGFLDDKVALEGSHSREQICRALMEGVVFEMRQKIEQLAQAGINADRITMVGGPSESSIWPRIMAEVTGLEIKLINGQTAGAVGAAILAALGADLYPNLTRAFAAMGGEGKFITPAAESVRLYDPLYHRYRERFYSDQK